MIAAWASVPGTGHQRAGWLLVPHLAREILGGRDVGGFDTTRSTWRAGPWTGPRTTTPRPVGPEPQTGRFLPGWPGRLERAWRRAGGPHSDALVLAHQREVAMRAEPFQVSRVGRPLAGAGRARGPRLRTSLGEQPPSVAEQRVMQNPLLGALVPARPRRSTMAPDGVDPARCRRQAGVGLPLGGARHPARRCAAALPACPSRRSVVSAARARQDDAFGDTFVRTWLHPGAGGPARPASARRRAHRDPRRGSSPDGGG